MHAWWSAMRSLGVAVVVVYCCGLWLPVDAGGYHCTGTTGRDNQLFKCTALDNRNSTDSNRTVIDYTVNQTGPDVTIDEARTLLVNLKIQNLSTIHVSCVQTRSRGNSACPENPRENVAQTKKCTLVKNRIRRTKQLLQKQFDFILRMYEKGFLFYRKLT